MITMETIKSLMQPMHHPNFCHTALIDATDGKHAINLAILRWTADAKKVSLTQWELPPDATGRIYTIDIFIGKVVDTKYADWAKGVQRGKRGHDSANNHKKGNYLTIPHVHFDNIQSGKRRPYRPFVHTIIAYVYPPLREQYAQAVMDDMTANNRSFKNARVQVNHMDKNTYNNLACNLEVITASANSIHRVISIAGDPYSMLLHKCRADGNCNGYPELREYLEVLSDAPCYTKRICQQLSQAQLPADTDTVKVCIQSITGNKVKSVQITNQSIWGLLCCLYIAKAHHICI